MPKNIYLTLALLAVYGLAEAHLVEAHLQHAGEKHELEEGLRQKRNEENLQILNDENSSYEEKKAAVQQLVKDEGLS